MTIVGGFALSHTGLMVTRRGEGQSEMVDRVFAGFEEVRLATKALAPDALVIVATDHMRAFPLTNVVPISIGISTSAHGMGDVGVDECVVPIQQDLARALLTGCLDRGVDMAFSEQSEIDHSFVVPLGLITPDFDIPIVPITVNCNVPPRLSFARCLAIGSAMGEVLSNAELGRVVVIGSGGLSHWVGSDKRRAFMNEQIGNRFAKLSEFPLDLPETAFINSEFDAMFLQTIGDGGLAGFVPTITDSEIDRLAGNGAQELRNWMIAAACCGYPRGEVVAYEAVPEWLTGIGIIRFLIGGAS